MKGQLRNYTDMEEHCPSLREDALPTFTVTGGRENPIKHYAPRK